MRTGVIWRIFHQRTLLQTGGFPEPKGRSPTHSKRMPAKKGAHLFWARRNYLLLQHQSSTHRLKTITALNEEGGVRATFHGSPQLALWLFQMHFFEKLKHKNKLSQVLGYTWVAAFVASSWKRVRKVETAARRSVALKLENLTNWKIEKDLSGDRATANSCDQRICKPLLNTNKMEKDRLRRLWFLGYSRP
jgi:hypothetical protein